MTITAHCYPGLSLQVRLMQGATPVGAVLNMTESAQAGYYTVATPGGLADGAYQLLLINGGQVIGQNSGIVRSGVFVDAAVLADIPPAVRTNLATELGRMDVAVSTRAAPGAAMALTPGERTTLAAQIEAALLADGDGQAFVAAIVAAIGNVNVNQAVLIAAIRADLERAGGLLDMLPTLTEIEASAILAKQAQLNAVKAKTDLLPAAPAAVGDIPTAATVAAAVRTNLTTELGRIDATISSRESEASAATRATADQTEHDATQTAIAAIAAIGDPLTKPVPGTYPAGSAGEALGKLVIGPPDEPAIVIPGAPAEVDMCRVYGYTETVANVKKTGVKVTFTLVVPANLAVASERLIGERKVEMCSDAQGRLLGPTGDPWVDLQRNDLLDTASGTTHYLVSSKQLGIEDKQITLTTPVVNLRDILVA